MRYDIRNWRPIPAKDDKFAAGLYGGNKFGGNQMESPRNYGLSSTMPIGIENSNNDRGDEINLDELQRYIGGGAN